MAAKQPKVTPRHCIQHSRFTKQDGWLLKDLSLSLNGNIAVTGWDVNARRTYIDVYTNVRHSDSRDKPKIIYSKEFEKYEYYNGRYVSFIDDDVLVSCLGNKLEVFQVNKDEVLRSRRVNGRAWCLSVRERREIFIGFYQSNKITVYDVIDLNEIKSIILQGIQDGYYPYDMTAIADRIVVCLESSRGINYKSSLIFEEKRGNILSELIKSTDTSRRNIKGITVNMPLSVVVIAVFDHNRAGQQLIFYSLLSENNCSFLIVEVESGVTRIRISDRGDRMITGNYRTGEVKVYDMTEFCSYSRLKQNLVSKLQKDDCVKLIKYFALPSYQSDVVLRSAAPAENLLLALEETGVLQPANVNRLIEAFNHLTIDSTCLYLVDFYKKTRMQVTSYDRFLAALSAHLTASLPADLCEFFKISDEKKKSIVSSQNSGLTLLLALDEMGFITSYKVESLERALTEMQLIQAVAKIHEYQSTVEEDENLLQGKDITEEGKKTLFIQGLQKRMKAWYETMTPVPWKKSCRWRCTDLFVGSRLILTDKKTKETSAPADADTKMADIKILYSELFSHEKLKSETQILIKGDPGSGKTMLLSQLAYDWCQGKFKEIDILIYLPLKFVEQKPIVQTIKEFYFPGDERLSLSDIEYLLLNEETSKFLLLDGLEDYKGVVTKEEDKVVTVMSQVKFSSCKVVISSHSGYGKHMPNSVELKLAKFDDIERNAYIQKVFSDSPEKQKEVTKVIKENVFLHDLCSTPLLFVFLVHNMESLVNLDIGQISKIAPFMKNVLYALHSLGKVISQKEDSGPSYKKEDEVVLEELAFSGLCGKYQQLSWPKEVIEFKVSSIREWIDAGVLVVEENILATVSLMRRDHHLPRARADDVTVTEEKEDSESLVSGATAEPHPDVDSGVKSTIEPESSEFKFTTTEKSSTSARYVPLQIRFAHKIIQEWFAAKYLVSSMISRLRKAEYIQKHLTEKLLFVNSSDLCFFLWFAVALYPSCCPYILKHLLSSNRTEEGNLPKHVMDFIFLCFSECNGEQVHGIQAAVTDVCKEEITLHPDDSRLVQQAKVAMLELASKCGIMCRKLILANIVNSATGDTLHFTSGVSVNVLDTLEVLEVSDCNGNLTDEDCANVLEFIKTCDWLKDVCLKISKQPPRVGEDIIDQFRESGKTIIWIMGPDQKQRLNTVTGEWMIDIGESPASFEIGISRNFGWGEKTKLEAEETISKEGGPLEIPDTGFKIDIPPDALQEGLEECNICMKIVPPDVSNETDTEFTSNSSATVELLPNNLTFKEPFELTLPHSLQLKKGAEYKAKIFVSHHEEGMYPCWEEQTDALYELTETTCKIWLNSFCWVKYVIDGKTVEAQRVQVFVAGKYMSSSDTLYETEAGFFPDTAGAGETFRSNKNLHVASKKTFLLYRKGKQPLKFLLQKITPSEWIHLSHGELAKEIPFESIDQSKQSSCRFIFAKQSSEPLIPRFIFRAAQGERSIRLIYRPEVQDQTNVSTQTE